MERKFKLPENSRKIAFLTLFLLFGITSAFGQKNASLSKDKWYQPIIERHKIDINYYNYKNTFTLVKPDTTLNEKCLELGNSDSFKSGKVAFKDFVLITLQNDGIYWIVRSMVAHHDFDENVLEIGKSTLESFNLNSKDINPISIDTIKTTRYDINRLTMELTK
jgi:hypothetical protein